MKIWVSDPLSLIIIANIFYLLLSYVTTYLEITTLKIKRIITHLLFCKYKYKIIYFG